MPVGTWSLHSRHLERPGEPSAITRVVFGQKYPHAKSIARFCVAETFNLNPRCSPFTRSSGMSLAIDCGGIQGASSPATDVSCRFSYDYHVDHARPLIASIAHRVVQIEKARIVRGFRWRRRPDGVTSPCRPCRPYHPTCRPGARPPAGLSSTSSATMQSAVSINGGHGVLQRGGTLVGSRTPIAGPCCTPYSAGRGVEAVVDA